MEYRLTEGLKFENRSDLEIALIGTGHQLTIKLVPIGSAAEIEARKEALEIYDSYITKTHGDLSYRYHWLFSHRENCECGCAENQWMQKCGTIDQPFTSELYHMHFRLDGEYGYRILKIFFDHSDLANQIGYDYKRGLRRIKENRNDTVF